MSELIRFENVGKIYKTGSVEYIALHDVNLSIDEGELVVVLGPSGQVRVRFLIFSGVWILQPPGRFSLPRLR